MRNGLCKSRGLNMEENKIKVLQVLDVFYPKFDGPCLVVTSYAKSFIKMGLDAKVAVPKYPKYKDNQPFEIVRVSSVPSKEGYRCALPCMDKNLKKFLKENNFDLIHIHSPFTMCSFFTKYGKKHNIPTIFTFHTKYREDFERTLKLKSTQNFMMKYILRNINRATYVWTVSDGAADCLREYGYKKNIKVIRNGTDLVCPENSIDLVDDINKKHNLKEDEIVFLSVGRIVENKKLQLAIKAMKIVAESGLKFKYLIVGAGSYEDELKKLVSNMNLDEYVIFTGKIMDRNLLSAYYLRADLFIFASTFDTASLAPIEAAAMKLPTLMNAGCSTSEIIDDNVNGYLAIETPEAWAEKIMEIINNREGLRKMGDVTFKQVYRTWDNVAEEVYKNYQEVLKNKKK